MRLRWYGQKNKGRGNGRVTQEEGRVQQGGGTATKVKKHGVKTAVR